MARIFTLIVMVTSLFVCAGVSAASEPTSEDKVSTYNRLVDEVIQRYEIKSSACDSACEAIRRDAALACIKTAYFKAYKKELVWKMNERKLEPKQHKISQFLNQSFYELVRYQNRKS